MGRPKKYNEEVQGEADYYVDNYAEFGDAIPSIEGLAEHLGVCRTTLYSWKDEIVSDEYLYTLERIASKQKRVTLNKGLTGDFSSVIAKLVLANHGMHDKQDSTLSGPNGGAIKTESSWVVKPVSPAKKNKD